MVKFVYIAAAAALAHLAASAPAPTQVEEEQLEDKNKGGPRARVIKMDHYIYEESFLDFQVNHYYSFNVSTGSNGEVIPFSPDVSRSQTSVPVNACSSDDETGCNYHYDKSKTFGPKLGDDVAVFGDPKTYPPSDQVLPTELHDENLRFGGFKIRTPIGIPKTQNGPDLGFMGFGPSNKLGYNAPSPHRSVLSAMVDQKIINSRTYSYDARSAYSDTGTLILGGADTCRFQGELVKVPFVKGENGEFSTSIKLKSYGQTLSTGQKFDYPVKENNSILWLDSQNQFNRMRHELVDPLFRDLGAKNDGGDAYYVDCAVRERKGTWDFGFEGGVVIKMPYKNFIMPFPAPKSPKGTCMVSILTTWQGQNVLGLGFFSAAYLAFDLDNQVVGMAQLAPDCNGAHCPSNIVTFGKGANAIPKLVGGCSGRKKC